MSDIRAEFEALVQRIRTSPASQAPADVSLEAKARLYALYKQATEGDVTGSRPGMLDAINRFKYDAHAKLTGLSREEAMRRYIDQVRAAEARG